MPGTRCPSKCVITNLWYRVLRKQIGDYLREQVAKERNIQQLFFLRSVLTRLEYISVFWGIFI